MGSIVLNTEIPGPRSRELTARKDSTIARAKGLWMPMWIDHGRGALLHDVDGNTFIDFAGGIGCLNIGHAHPRVVKAVQDAAAKFLHTDFTVVPYESYVALAERLLPLVPIAAPSARRSSTRAPRRWRTRSRSRRPPPAGPP